MAAICQDSSNPSSNLFGAHKNIQGPSGHNYYPHCGYEAPNEGPHQYTHDGYGQYQMTSLHHQQQQLHPHHPQHPHLNHPHHQQTWGSYGMGMTAAGVMGGGPTTRSPYPLPLGDEWTHGYLMGGNNGSPQTPYGYQYHRPSTNTHPSPLDYGTPPHPTDSSDHQGLEDSLSPQTPSPRGSSPSGSIMGPGGQGSKSLRAPYEWMKPSASLPIAGHGAVISGKTRTKDKYRVVYSDHQRLELEKEFHFSKYITIRRKAEIAGQLGLSERQVKIWFQNRRAKERKQNKKREEQALNQPQSQTNGKDNGHIQQQQQQQQHQQHQHHHQQNYISPSPTMQHPLHQNGHIPAASFLIPKLEVEDEMAPSVETNGIGQHNDLSNMTRMGYHTNPNSSIPTSEQVFLAMNNPIASSAMAAPPGAVTGSLLMDRCQGPNPVNRYHHEGYPLPPNGVSPGNHVTEDMMTSTIKMTSSDSSNNSMNLSGSSDSGVLSSQ